MIDAFSAAQVEAFDRDGFLILEEGLVSPTALDLLRERYEPLFDGVYETGIRPDEVNWVPGRDPEDRTRQICNGWRADRVQNGPPQAGFSLVRGWIENQTCIEIGGRDMREEYERFFREAAARARH